MLFRLSYVRRCARLESNQHACRIRAVLSTELRAFEERVLSLQAARPARLATSYRRHRPDSHRTVGPASSLKRFT